MTLVRLNRLHVEQFRKLIPGASGVLCQSNGDDVSSFLTDWTGKYRARSKSNDFVVLKPTCTTEVSEILKFCNRERIGVVPQGGNTGLVGGATPYSDDSPFHSTVILSMSRMNQIKSIDTIGGVVKMESGCILESVDEECRRKGNLMIPLDLGAKGSCQMGGILSTNAGGIRFLRYGSLHGSCLGLEVVLPDGRILNDMRGLRKDNTGYDLKQLFIGSEGTLGIITAVAIQAVQQPASVNVSCFKVSSFEDVLRLLNEAKASLGEILSAFEFWDSQCHVAVNDHVSDIFESSPNCENESFYVLIETSGSDQGHDEEKMTRFLEKIMGNELVMDGVMAQDKSQQMKFWARREGIPEACSKQKANISDGHVPYGQVHKYDISVPTDKYYTLVPLLKERFKHYIEGFKVFGFGHVGDGNIHINVVDCGAGESKMTEIGDFIFYWVSKNGGSVSAEHGIGQAKREHLSKSKDSISIDLMRSIKNLFDPNGILNPGKVL